MSGRSVLQTICVNLESDKQKDRTQGLQDVRELLPSTRPDKKLWLRLLQAIFQIVVDEQRAYLRKAGSTSNPALKRVKDAAQAVRLIIEKAVAELPRKAVKSVVNHFLSTVIVQGQLFDPIALDYLKAFHSLLSYPPHLENIEQQSWIQALSLCFSAVLGDPVRSTQAVLEEQLMDVDDSQTAETNASSSHVNGTQRKRKAAGPLRSQPENASSPSTQSSLQIRSAGQDVIELMACIELLVCSSEAPLLTHGEALLAKYLRFFRAFPNETSAHLPALTGFNRILKELHFNNRTVMTATASQIWPILLSLWPTKITAMKEQIVIALSMLYDFLAFLPASTSGHMLYGLFELIRQECNSRWGIEALNLDALAFDVTSTSASEKSPFTLALVRAGDAFTATQALSWQVLSLAGKALRILATGQGSDKGKQREVSPINGFTASASAKRQKLEDAVSALLDDLDSSDAKTTVHILQILAVYAASGNLGQPPWYRILQLLSQLGTHADADVQIWTFVTSAVIFDVANVFEGLTEEDMSNKITTVITNIWKQALRRMSELSTCRAACLLVLTVLRKASLPPEITTPDIELLVRLLDSQGPACVSDAAIGVLQHILTMAYADARLQTMSVADAIHSRMHSSWNLTRLTATPGTLLQPATSCCPLPLSSMLIFLGNLCAFPTTRSAARPLSAQIIVDGPITEYACYASDTRSMRAWYFDACIDSDQPGNAQELSNAASRPAVSDTLANKVTRFLDQQLTAASLLCAGDNEDTKLRIPAETLRRCIELAVLVVFFEVAAEQHCSTRGLGILDKALSMLQSCVLRWSKTTWNSWQRALIIQPLFGLIDLPSTESSAFSKILIEAGETSGVHIALPTARSSTSAISGLQTPSVDDVWSSAAVRDTFSQLTRHMSSVLAANSAHAHEAEPSYDDFDDVPSNGRLQNGHTVTRRSEQPTYRADGFTTSLCVRWIAKASTKSSENTESLRFRSAFPLLLDGSGASVVEIGRHVMQMMEETSLELHYSDLDSLTERIGGEFLASYEYGRSLRMQEFALQFLQVTSAIWGQETSAEPPFADKARRLAAWFAGQNRKSSIVSADIRISLMRLLESFLLPTRSLACWGHESEEAACTKSVPIPPVTLLVSMLSDADFRVRFRLATTCGRIATHVQTRAPVNEQQGLWEDIAASGSFELAASGFETNLTLLLTYGNVLVASEFFRPLAYMPIILFTALDSTRSVARYIGALLSGIVARLHLDSVAHLYTYMARYAMAEMLLVRRETLAIPDPAVFGFASKKQLHEADFPHVGAMVLTGPRPDYFGHMCSYIGVSATTGLSLCMPVVVAFELVLRQGNDADGEDSIRLSPIAQEQVAKIALQMSITASAYVSGIQDDTVTELFACIHEPSYDTGSLAQCMLTDACTAVLQTVLGSVDLPFRSQRLAPPSVRFRAVIKALSSPQSPVDGALKNESTAFSVIQRLTFEAATHPFTNQQLRLLHNLVLFVSLAHSTVAGSTTLLAHLMERLIPLLKIADLFVVASHTVRWCLAAFTVKALAGSVIDDARFAVTLVRFAEISCKSKNSPKPETMQAATLLLTAAQMYLQKTISSKLSQLLKCARSAVCFWPQHTSLHSLLRGKDIERSLMMHSELPNHCILRCLLHLVQQSRTAASQDLIQRVPQLLWQALRRLPQDYASRAEGLGGTLADLLEIGGGTVRMPSLDAQPPTIDREALTPTMVHAELFQLIAAALHSPEPRLASTAYEAARNALTAEPQLSRNCSAEITLLAKTPPVVTPTRVDFPDVLDLKAGLLAVGSKSQSSKDRLWTQDLASTLASYLSLRDPFFVAVAKIVRADASVAKSALPLLVSGVLLEDVHKSAASDQLRAPSARSVLSEFFDGQLRSLSRNAKDIFNILIQLRRHSMPYDAAHQLVDASSHDKWLDVDFRMCAEVASRVGEHTVALLFAELDDVHAVNKMAAALASLDALLYRIYENIEDPDSFYSVQSRSSLGSLSRRLEHEGRWLEAVSVRGANYGDSLENSYPVAYGLLRHGLPQLAAPMLRHLSVPSDLGTCHSAYDPDVSYELAWRTANWDLPVSTPAGGSGPNGRLFCAFRAIMRDTDSKSVAVCIESMLSQECLYLCRGSDSSSQIDTRHISNLVALRSMQKWTAQSADEKISMATVEQSSIPVFERSETVRAMLLADLRVREERQNISDIPTNTAIRAASLECALWSHIADRARNHGSLQTALNAAVKGVHLSGLIASQSPHIALAKVLWAKGEHRDAVNTLRAVLEHLVGDVHAQARAEVLGQIGAWIATARSERPADLGRNYFDPALEILASLQDVNTSKAKSEVVARYATFCDDQYQQSSQRLPEIEQLDAFSRRKDAEVKELSTIKASRDSAGSDVGSRRRAAKAQSDHDRRMVTEFRDARRNYLRTALRMYAQVLSLADDKDDNVYRLCGLWLENASDLALNEQLREELERVPVHKFIPLVHQLSARLSSEATKDGQSGFQKALRSLLTRLCRSHPFHGLYQIRFLHAPEAASTNGVKANSSRRSSLTPSASSQAKRSDAAGSLLNAIKAQPKSAETLRLVDMAIAAYIDWALFPIEKPKSTRKLIIPASHPLLRLTNVQIPVSTVHLPVDKTAEYAPLSMPCIAKYATTFSTAGGVHLPKITECHATDGQVYKQLVSAISLVRLIMPSTDNAAIQFKGGDDVRQDAVMEQVFAVANDLLQRDDRAKLRSLAVRTYKVLPLNSEAGLLEFVRNSQPIGDWLTKAHDRYRPQDMKVLEARRKLGEYGNAEKDERVAIYEEVTQKIRPVMRHFFFEKQHIPARWFEMRLLYARSTAVMSIVGYILGLGDRHVSNILIDLSKGELVPIDLGIAFEAGRTLPTPELVPFRLTRDIVDGFGMSGVEGAFRKCSEETMRVLRARSSALLTILEVFRFDPLQRWTASAEKVKRLQGSQAADRTRSEGDQSSSMLTDADRAIATVSQKLNSQLSIEYQVNDLILQATDVVNLALIFPGWQQAL